MPAIIDNLLFVESAVLTTMTDIMVIARFSPADHNEQRSLKSTPAESSSVRPPISTEATFCYKIVIRPQSVLQLLAKVTFGG